MCWLESCTFLLLGFLLTSHQFPVLAKYLAEAGRLSEVNTDFLDSTSERAKPRNTAKSVMLVNVNRRNTLLISI